MIFSRAPLPGLGAGSARVVIHDRIAVTDPAYRVTFLLHGPGRPHLDGGGVVRIATGSSVALATTVLPAGVAPVLVDEPTNLSDGPYYANDPPEERRASASRCGARQVPSSGGSCTPSSWPGPARAPPRPRGSTATASTAWRSTTRPTSSTAPGSRPAPSPCRTARPRARRGTSSRRSRRAPGTASPSRARATAAACRSFPDRAQSRLDRGGRRPGALLRSVRSGDCGADCQAPQAAARAATSRGRRACTTTGRPPDGTSVIARLTTLTSSVARLASTRGRSAASTIFIS